jgi:hypothetical protein
LFIVVNYTFAQLWLCGNWPFGQISWWHIKHVADHYICDPSTCIKSKFEVYRPYRCRSILCQSHENKKTCSNNQYAIRSAVRSALKRCMGKRNELLRMEKTLICAFRLADSTCTQSENFRSVVSNSDRCTCQDRNRNQNPDAFNWSSVLLTM